MFAISNLKVAIFVGVFAALVLGFSGFDGAYAADKNVDQYLARVGKSLDHIVTFQSDVEDIKRTHIRNVTMNYTVAAATANRQAIRFSMPTKLKGFVYVRNPKGIYSVQGGIASKMRDTFQWPLQLPQDIVSRLFRPELLAELKLKLREDGPSMAVIELINVGAGADPTMPSRIELRLNKPDFTLASVRQFYGVETESKDYVEIEYTQIAGKPVVLRTEEASVSRRTGHHFYREKRFSNIRINEPLDGDLFDEEAY